MSIAVVVGLLAAVPAMAGEMTADEARRFVVGKMFSYNCFEGTRGQGACSPMARWSARSSSRAGAGAYRARCRRARCR